MYGVEIKPKLVELEDDGQNEHDVAFDGIKDVIIQGIRNAKYTIWVAVAWFSDRDIFQELLAKKKQGISIRIGAKQHSIMMKHWQLLWIEIL